MHRLIYRLLEDGFSRNLPKQKGFLKSNEGGNSSFVLSVIFTCLIILSSFYLSKRLKVKLILGIDFLYLLILPVLFGCSIAERYPTARKRAVISLLKYDIGHVFLASIRGKSASTLVVNELMSLDASTLSNNWRLFCQASFFADDSGVTSLSGLTRIINDTEFSASPGQLWSKVTQLAGVFHMNGCFQEAEKIERYGKKAIDSLFSRSVGLRNEACYFTAIGHMSLIEYLIKGIILKIVERESINLVRIDKKVANRAFGDLITEKCRESGIEVSSEFDYRNLEFDLETYPTRSGTYISSRRTYSRIQMLWESKDLGPLLTLNEHVASRGSELLRNLGLPKDSWFAGLHLRDGMDINRAGRDAEFKNYIDAIHLIESSGGWVVGLGPDYSRSYCTRKLRNFINLGNLNLNSEDFEVLNLYTWASAKFFIGGLSGGTNPPGLFGTPILWSDIHPLAHFRPPASQDRILPRRILNLKTQQYLTLSEEVSNNHKYSQSENPLKLLQNGYQLLHNTSEQIAESTREMIHEYVEGVDSDLAKSFLIEMKDKTNKIMSNVDLGFGAQFSISFILANPDFLSEEPTND